MNISLKILSITELTHDVRCIRLEKPRGYHFAAGQATEVSIDNPLWQNEKRPFTFTALDEDPYLEFIIKCYPQHEGVTGAIQKLSAGDRMMIGEPWGAIEYSGPGVFIAGGAGITPFIAILRQLHRENKLENNRLFFSNKTRADIIHEEELTKMLGKNAVFVLTDEPNRGTHAPRFIDSRFLEENISDFHTNFYICGPDKMTSDITEVLLHHGARPDAVIFER